MGGIKKNKKKVNDSRRSELFLTLCHVTKLQAVTQRAIFCCIIQKLAGLEKKETVKEEEGGGGGLGGVTETKQRRVG